MIISMDAAGRLVIPLEIRRQAAIEPGMPLEVRWGDGVIEIEPQRSDITIEREGRFLVARPKAQVPALRHAMVERIRQDLNARRSAGDGIGGGRVYDASIGECAR